MAEGNRGGGDPCSSLPEVGHRRLSEDSVESLDTIRTRLSIMMEIDDFLLTAGNNDPELLYEAYRTSSEQKSSDGSLSRIYDLDEFMKVVTAVQTVPEQREEDNGVYPGLSGGISHGPGPHGHNAFTEVFTRTKKCAEPNADSLTLIDLEEYGPSVSSQRDSSGSPVNQQVRKRSPMTKTSRTDQSVNAQDPDSLQKVCGKPPIPNAGSLIAVSKPATSHDGKNSTQSRGARSHCHFKSPQTSNSMPLDRFLPSTSDLDVAASDPQTSCQYRKGEYIIAGNDSNSEYSTSSETAGANSSSFDSEMIQHIHEINARELRAYLMEENKTASVENIQYQKDNHEEANNECQISTNRGERLSSEMSHLACQTENKALPNDELGSECSVRSNWSYGLSAKDEKSFEASTYAETPNLDNSILERVSPQGYTSHQVSLNREEGEYAALRPSLLNKVPAGVSASSVKRTNKVSNPSYEGQAFPSDSSSVGTMAGNCNEADMGTCTSVYVNDSDNTGRSFKTPLAKIYHEPDQAPFLVLNSDVLDVAVKKSGRTIRKMGSTTNATVARAEKIYEHEKSLLELEESLMVEQGMFDEDDLSSDEESPEGPVKVEPFSGSFRSLSRHSSAGMSVSLSHNISYEKHFEKYDPDKSPLRRLPSHGSSLRAMATNHDTNSSLVAHGSSAHVEPNLDRTSSGGRKYKLLPRFLSDLWGTRNYSQVPTIDSQEKL